MNSGSWTLEETNRLVKLAKANTPASTISMILGRPREEVDAKIADLAVHRPLHEEGRPASSSEVRPSNS